MWDMSTGTAAPLHKYIGMLRVARNPFPLSISSLFHPCKHIRNSMGISSKVSEFSGVNDNNNSDTAFTEKKRDKPASSFHSARTFFH
jgi:hypothetical protein